MPRTDQLDSSKGFTGLDVLGTYLQRRRNKIIKKKRLQQKRHDENFRKKFEQFFN